MNDIEHYFAADPHSPSAPQRIRVPLAGRDRVVVTDRGVFSNQHLDTGTAVLLDEIALPRTGTVLDLGCGWGPIALSIALAGSARVWAVDINDRALELTRANAESLGANRVTACRPEGIPAGMTFDAIWSNPPIRIGKQALHELLLTWLPRLRSGGDAWLVVQKHLGSDSLQRWLATALGDGFEVDRAASVKGFRVLRAHRR